MRQRTFSGCIHSKYIKTTLNHVLWRNFSKCCQQRFHLYSRPPTFCPQIPTSFSEVRCWTLRKFLERLPDPWRLLIKCVMWRHEHCSVSQALCFLAERAGIGPQWPNSDRLQWENVAFQRPETYGQVSGCQTGFLRLHSYFPGEGVGALFPFHSPGRGESKPFIPQVGHLSNTGYNGIFPCGERLPQRASRAAALWQLRENTSGAREEGELGRAEC